MAKLLKPSLMHVSYKAATHDHALFELCFDRSFEDPLLWDSPDFGSTDLSDSLL